VVLGSFPGVASLQAQQYYAHPRNQFWPLLSALWVRPRRDALSARLAEVLRRGLGIWDVYASCRREGSLDSAIEAAEPNDLAGLRRRAPRLEAWRTTAASRRGRCGDARARRAGAAPALHQPGQRELEFRTQAGGLARCLRRPWTGLTPHDDDEEEERTRAGPGHHLRAFDGVRYLHLGTPWVQGAMNLKKPARWSSSTSSA
jgi:hypothetical protein